jgi:hypothetical protein
MVAPPEENMDPSVVSPSPKFVGFPAPSRVPIFVTPRVGDVKFMPSKLPIVVSPTALSESVQVPVNIWRALHQTICAAGAAVVAQADAAVVADASVVVAADSVVAAEAAVVAGAFVVAGAAVVAGAFVVAGAAVVAGAFVVAGAAVVALVVVAGFGQGSGFGQVRVKLSIPLHINCGPAQYQP